MKTISRSRPRPLSGLFTTSGLLVEGVKKEMLKLNNGFVDVHEWDKLESIDTIISHQDAVYCVGTEDFRLLLNIFPKYAGHHGISCLIFDENFQPNHFGDWTIKDFKSSSPLLSIGNYIFYYSRERLDLVLNLAVAMNYGYNNTYSITCLFREPNTEQMYQTASAIFNLRRHIRVTLLLPTLFTWGSHNKVLDLIKSANFSLLNWNVTSDHRFSEISFFESNNEYSNFPRFVIKKKQSLLKIISMIDSILANSTTSINFATLSIQAFHGLPLSVGVVQYFSRLEKLLNIRDYIHLDSIYLGLSNDSTINVERQLLYIYNSMHSNNGKKHNITIMFDNVLNTPLSVGWLFKNLVAKSGSIIKKYKRDIPNFELTFSGLTPKNTTIPGNRDLLFALKAREVRYIRSFILVLSDAYLFTKSPGLTEEFTQLQPILTSNNLRLNY